MNFSYIIFLFFSSYFERWLSISFKWSRVVALFYLSIFKYPSSFTKDRYHYFIRFQGKFKNHLCWYKKKKNLIHGLEFHIDVVTKLQISKGTPGLSHMERVEEIIRKYPSLQLKLKKKLKYGPLMTQLVNNKSVEQPWLDRVYQQVR